MRSSMDHAVILEKSQVQGNILKNAAILKNVVIPAGGKTGL